MSLGGRSESPASAAAGMPRLTRVPTEPSTLLGARSNLRITKSRDNSQAPSPGRGDVFGDEQGGDYGDQYARPEERHRAPSWGAQAQQDGNGNGYGAGGGAAKKAPPPPPPSRASKPKPPPPPMKRSNLSTTDVPRY
jgi:hypothetical protein